MVLNVIKPFLRSSVGFHTSTRFKQLQKKNFSLSSKHLSEVIPHESSPAVAYLKNKFYDVVAWYEKFTGLDEVRLAQNRVLQAEEKFSKAQEKRRELTVSLSEISSRLKALYAELDNTTRGEDRYVFLITQEHKLLKEELAVQEKFSMAEKEERDYFAALSSSVKESHEKERAQAERTKYWSIIGSILGTVIGFIGTSFNNHFRMKELKQLIKDSNKTDTLENLRLAMKENDEKLDSYISKINLPLSNSNEKNTNVEELLVEVNSKLTNVENSVKVIEQSDGKKIHMVTSNNEAELFVLPFINLAETMHEEHKQTKILLCGFALLSIVIPYIAKYYF